MREQCPQSLHDYWNFREELTIKDGLILKREHTLIPPSLRKETLKTIHEGHLGIRELLQPEPPCYPWQILNSDLFEYNIKVIIISCYPTSTANFLSLDSSLALHRMRSSTI